MRANVPLCANFRKYHFHHHHHFAICKKWNLADSGNSSHDLKFMEEKWYKWKFIWCICRDSLRRECLIIISVWWSCLWFRQMRDRMITKSKQNETKILSAWSITVQAALTEALCLCFKSLYFCPICRLFRTYSVMTLFAWESHEKLQEPTNIWNMCATDETVLNVWLFGWSHCRRVNK